MNVKTKNKNECSGCTACSMVCPHKAITMVPDRLGFKYPDVDSIKCTDCGLCLKICPFSEHYKTEGILDKPIIFGARANDEQLLAASQSGGAANAISTSFINNGGIVYGVCFDDRFHVIHDRVARLDELSRLRGSKYVQSDLRDTFLRIKVDLEHGNKVLFIGTACQVAGLNAYIPQKEKKGLYTIDILCHASPSPALWESYLKYVESKTKSKILSVNMRDKSFGWRSFQETYQLSNGQKIKRESYISLFFSHLSIRKSCEQCPFTNHKRVGDITVSDFWGWSQYHKEWNDNKGVSMIMINYVKGQILFNSIKEKILFKESDENEIDTLQPQLSKPSRPNPLRDQFEDDFYKKGYQYISKKYGDENWKERIKKFIRPIYILIKKTIFI